MSSSDKGLDPYAALGIPRTATTEEIRAAYLDLVGKFHPDRHQGNPLEELAAARLAEINQAYEILSDPLRRANFDASSSTQRDTSRGRGQPKLIKLISLAVVVLLIVRFFPLVLRLLEGLFGIIFRSLAGLRGTPFVVAGVILVASGLIFALVRRRRKK